MKVSKDFELYEYIDKNTYRYFGDKSIWFIDNRLFDIVQKLRDTFGPAIINNYFNGGKRNWSGLRTKNSPFYSKYSQHSFGRAVDIIFNNHDAFYVREQIKNNENYWFNVGIRAIEENVSWLHIDLRNTNLNKIYYFKK